MRRRTGERTRRQWLFLQLSHLQLGQWLLVEQWGSHTHWSVSLVVWDFWMNWVQSQIRESYSTTISPNNTILTWISSLTMQISNIEPSTTMQCHYIVTALVHPNILLWTSISLEPKCSEGRYLRLMDYSLFTLNTPQKWSRSKCHSGMHVTATR